MRCDFYCKLVSLMECSQRAYSWSKSVVTWSRVQLRARDSLIPLMVELRD